MSALLFAYSPAANAMARERLADVAVNDRIDALRALGSGRGRGRRGIVRRTMSIRRQQGVFLPYLTRAERSTASDHRYVVPPRGLSPRAVAGWVRNHARTKSGTRVPVRRETAGST